MMTQSKPSTARSNHSECPACLQPASEAQPLFVIRDGNATCDVLRCPCGLTYKAAIPVQPSIDAIYGVDYEHFDTTLPNETLRVSGREKLERCMKALGASSAALARPLRLLDYGCGGGTFVGIARDAGFDAVGIDPYLPPELESAHLRRSQPSAFASRTFDIVTMLNVAEHLTRPRDTFAAVMPVLKPGGCLLVTCPWGDSVARRLYRQRWVQLAHPEHLLFWTCASLDRMLEQLGFRGTSAWRALGSPFPFGRLGNVPSSAAPRPPAQESQPPRPRAPGAFATVVKAIQRSDVMSNAARSIIAASHLGDYLEYVIRLDGHLE